jgi:hypothetical protein
MNWNKISKARTKEEQEIMKRGLICNDNVHSFKPKGDLAELIQYLKDKQL